jgi:cytoskeletal protein CcmA (bactofilin family)
LDNSRKEQSLGTRTSIAKKIEVELEGLDIDKEMDVIGLASHFKGNFRFGPYTRIEGRIEGNIESSGILIISAMAEVKAEINGKTVVIDGKVSGNINADDCVMVQEHGTISGNIKAPYIEVDQGASINGSISMGKYHSRFIELESLTQGS